jgi:hypothetical protein
LVETALAERAVYMMPPNVAQWLHWLPFTNVWDDDEREVAYRDLALYITPVGLACLNGAPGACKADLGVVADGDTIGAWFDAPMRRAMAKGEMHGMSAYNRVSEAVRELCVRGDDRSCREVLAHSWVRSPTSRNGRAQLLRYALVRGGPDAFQRLLSSKSSDLATQIESAAGVPFDSLVTVWRADVLKGEPPSPAPTPAEIASIVVSCAVLVGFVAWRRSQ